MGLLKKGDKVAIVACSNGLNISSKITLDEIQEVLITIGLNPILSNKLFIEETIYNGSNYEKATVLNDFFQDENIKAIFDISGGDLANGILEYLDFELIKSNPKPFFGYSDVTVILNSIYSKANIHSYLYQIRNMIGVNKEEQVRYFRKNFIDGEKNTLVDFKINWIQGEKLEGVVVGGNIRCFLKLAGTDYMPDFNDKILLLESLSGDPYKMTTFLNQYKQLKAFDKIRGIILGQFTEMENRNYYPSIVEILKNILEDNNIPIVKIDEIGHSQDSKCIIIGKKISISRENN